MKTYAQEAENIRLTLVAAILSVKEVVQWADSKLASLDQYDDDLGSLGTGPWHAPEN